MLKIWRISLKKGKRKKERKISGLYKKGQWPNETQKVFRSRSGSEDIKLQEGPFRV